MRFGELINAQLYSQGYEQLSEGRGDFISPTRGDPMS